MQICQDALALIGNSPVLELQGFDTGLGLALVSLLKGYKLVLVLVLPDKMSQEKISTLRCMGVEIIMTRSDVEKGHPEYYQVPAAFDTPVAAIMTRDLEVIDYRAPINEMMNVFARDHVAIVIHGESFLGIITRIDLINHLRKESA